MLSRLHGFSVFANSLFTSWCDCGRTFQSSTVACKSLLNVWATSHLASRDLQSDTFCNPTVVVVSAVRDHEVLDKFFNSLKQCAVRPY